MKRNLSLYCFAISFVLYEFTTYAANDMVMACMLNVVKDFGAAISYVALGLACYIFGNTLLQLFLGILAEHYGKRKILITGNVIFLLFTVFIAFSVNINMFLLGRVLQGTGLAFVAMGYALVHENFDDKHAVSLTALMGNVAILAPLLGPIIGGIIASHSSWRYVFVFSAITGIISLIGLIRYTPSSKQQLLKPNFTKTLHLYYEILTLPTFLLGAVMVGFIILPALYWISIAPTLIMHTLGLTLNYYFMYQLIAVGGILISSIINQIFAGRIAMSTLLAVDRNLFIAGLIILAISYRHIGLIAIGMCIVTLGAGLQLGVSMRIIGTLVAKSQSMLFSLMSFIQTIIFVVFIQIGNVILGYFNYSSLSFVILCVVVGSIAILLVSRFIQLNKTRVWV